MARRFALILSLALTAAACGGSDTVATYTSDVVGFSVDVPGSFQVIDIETDDVGALLEATDLDEAARTRIATTLLGTAASGFVLWAFDFDAGNADFIPNMNIVRLPRSPTDTVEALLPTIERDYGAFVGADVLEVEQFDNPTTGTSLLVEALFPISGSEDDSHSLQLITFTQDWSWTITYSYIDLSDDDRERALDSFQSFSATD